MVATPTAPVDYIPTQRDNVSTPNSIAMQREYAKALMQQKYKPPNAKYPFYTWANGLDDASAKIMAGMELRNADQRERNAYLGREVPGTGGSTSPTAAPGGAAPAAPFPGRPASSDRSSESTPAEAALNLSARGETSKTGHAALFNISPDTAGSKSYGPLGLNSKSGSVSNFVRDHPEFGLTAEPGTPEFDNQWRKAAATQKDEFGKAHEDWHKKNIMGGLFSSMTKAGVDPAIANDPRVQTYMADRKVQMGNAGLNTALAAASGATSPESFIHTVSQVDKDRVPLNFRTYLRDHPNDERGLHNRIDLRHNTALAMADPDTTGKMVDYYKSGGDTPVKLAGDPSASTGGRPTDRPSISTPFQPNRAPNSPEWGAMGNEWAETYNRMIRRGMMDPAEAAELTNKIFGAREKFMPQFGNPNEYGQGYKTEPGKPPEPYTVPGVLGKIEPFGKSGVLQRIYRGPDGQLHQEILRPQIQTPTLAPEPPKPSAVPATRPPTTPAPARAAPAIASPVTAPAAPVTPKTAPPAGIGPVLTDAPPSGPAVKPDMKTRVASLGDVVLDAATPGASSRVPKDEFGTQGFNTDDPIEAKALDYVKHAGEERKKVPPLTIQSEGAPNIFNLIEKGDIGALTQQEKNEEAYKDFLTKKLDTRATSYDKYQTSFRDAAAQANKLKDGFDEALEVIKSPEFQSGPAHEVVSLGRGLREQLGNMLDGLVKDYESKGEDAGMLKKARDWALDPKADTATANQVLSKVLAAATLQSLRGMLGPNSGQFRQYEMMLMREALGNPNMTPEAIATVLTMAQKANDRNIVLGKMASQYAAEHGGLDPTFEKYVNLFESNNPAYTHAQLEQARKEITKIGPKEGAAPGSTPPKPSTLPGLPSTDEISRERERRKKKE